VVAELLGGRRLESNPSDLDEKRLPMWLTKWPSLGDGGAGNLCARLRARHQLVCRRHTRDDVAVGVTFGCLKMLTRDELQASSRMSSATS